MNVYTRLSQEWRRMIKDIGGILVCILLVTLAVLLCCSGLSVLSGGNYDSGSDGTETTQDGQE